MSGSSERINDLKMEQNKNLDQFFLLFRDYLKEELELNGVSMVKELVYRFAMVQFRDTRGFESGKIEFIPKILSQMQSEFGAIFEAFAQKCFEEGYDLNFINMLVKRWLAEILKEIVPQ